MKTEMFKSIGLLVLFSLFALVLYPRSEQLILMLLIGITFFILLAFALRKIEKTQLQKGTGPIKPIYYVLQIVSVIYIIYFLLVLSVSWWEKKLVFNIFQATRGKVYFIITFAVGLFFLIYSRAFFIKNRRWPNSEDMTRDESRNLSSKEIIIVSVGLLLLFSMLGLLLHFNLLSK